ncbi:aldehyde dehydrogenase (NADP(+)) [Nocardioides sp. WV_118_6]
MTPSTARPHGLSIIAGEVGTPDGTGTPFRATDPATDALVEPVFHPATDDEVGRAVAAATACFDDYRATTPAVRAAFLRTIADHLEAAREALVARAGTETGLPEARLNGELSRTTNQLRLFARELDLGEHQGVRIDHAQPERQPAPAPDLRQRQVPLGPVLVFGASNFPFAFSTAGGDTASALAAGCPVIVKAHNSHAGTAELAGWAIVDAARACGMPAGVFSLVYGPGTTVGQRLAADPGIKAIAFTGSQGGGTALMRTAAARPEPVPVYAEMSSVNPVVLLPGAWAERATAIATGFVGSLTLGSGQFCTNPGLLFVPTAHADDVRAAVAAELRDRPGQTMLSPSISSAYADGIGRLAASDRTTLVAAGAEGPTRNAPAPAVYAADLADFATDDALREEVFGAASLIVTYDDVDALRTALDGLEGQLTISVHAEPADHADVAALLPTLERRAGRLILNDWPTGVEVNDAMVHGGPFPATSDSRTTSVGSAAILRFQRPVAYQGFTDALLPPAVADANPWGLPARVDGALVR